jgi:hypothetical protein
VETSDRPRPSHRPDAPSLRLSVDRRDTVEEKVLIAKIKRDLADAIISADNSLMHNLTREDLELLLS